MLCCFLCQRLPGARTWKCLNEVLLSVTAAVSKLREMLEKVSILSLPSPARLLTFLTFKRDFLPKTGRNGRRMLTATVSSNCVRKPSKSAIHGSTNCVNQREYIIKRDEQIAPFGGKLLSDADTAEKGSMVFLIMMFLKKGPTYIQGIRYGVNAFTSLSTKNVKSWCYCHTTPVCNGADALAVMPSSTPQLSRATS